MRGVYETGLAQLDSGNDEGMTFVVETDGKAVGSISLFSFDDLSRHG